ncbi:Aspartate--tRNA(Asp/Asn) ligase [Chlamydiales bacterium STE3]|nr:Aspartate--tRNA(Asp/Asn) ligase [Chlamydiales bacterium STE3]
MFDFSRTHTCGDLKKSDIGKKVTLSGWVHRRRDHGGLIFIDLRDRYGLTQLVFDPQKNSKNHHIAETLRSEWSISIKGEVIPRIEAMVNPKLPTGEIEIAVDELEVLSKAKTPPFSICDETIEVHEDLRLKYRYLDIRRGDVAKNLILRHKAMMASRAYLDKSHFVEINTPILGKSTPEGARDYLVPARLHSGAFYALPQSPQLFKQLLMVAGMDRYFQFATCFRDEDLRSDRQPEFTQIDIEMSYANPALLFPIVEGLISAIFKACLNVEIPSSFKRITYQESMARFGTDKPDLRFSMELKELSRIVKDSSFSVFLEQLGLGGIVKGLCVKGGADISRKGIEDYTQFVNRLGINGLAWMRYQQQALSSNIVKFFSAEQQKKLIETLNVEEGDLIFMIADAPQKCNQALDHLRRKIAKDRHLIASNAYEFLWVTDFPLFAWNYEEKRLESMHHPFTSPHFEDLDLIEKEPLKMRSSGYDLVLNGYEIGGGSQRIHNSELQEKIFKALKLTEEEIHSKFGFFVDALKYGTPPHLGIALGFDRVMMLIAKTENIRDVIAFPKTQKGSDLMMECPANVAKEQLKELKIKVEDEQFSWT